MFASIRNYILVVMVLAALLLLGSHSAAVENGKGRATQSETLTGTCLIRSKAGSDKYLEHRVSDPSECKIGDRAFLKATVADEGNAYFNGSVIYIPIDAIISILQPKRPSPAGGPSVELSDERDE